MRAGKRLKRERWTAINKWRVFGDGDNEEKRLRQRRVLLFLMFPSSSMKTLWRFLF